MAITLNISRILRGLLEGILLAIPMYGVAAEYEVPPNAPQSTLVLNRVNTPPVMALVFYTNGNNCTGRTGLPARGRPFWESKPLALESGKEFAFWFRGIKSELQVLPGMLLGSSTTCDLIVSFKPEAGMNYKLNYEVQKDVKLCAVSLVRLEPAGEVAEPSFKKRLPLYPSSDESPACDPTSK